MAAENLAEHERNALGRHIFGHVARLVNYLQSFEVHPHRMSWIGQPAVRKGIGSKQVTVLVVSLRWWNAQQKSHCSATRKCD